LSDCRSAALVSRDGSIDWFCAPRFDSPSAFARILDPGGGHWSIRPASGSFKERAYLGDGPVLRTVFDASGGTVALTDAMLLSPEGRGHEIGRSVPHAIAREVACTAGAVEMVAELTPRFEYGLTRPTVSGRGEDWTLSAGPTVLRLAGSVPHEIADGPCLRARFTLRAGESAGFTLHHTAAHDADSTAIGPPAAAIQQTIDGWRSWARLHEPYRGRYAGQVRRSAMVLQALTYQPSGAVIAAPTTSLPERVGDSWNWDYRFVWLRDLSFVLRALWVAACPDEPRRFFEWIAGSLGQFDNDRVQIMFGVEGERDLTEHALHHLAGHRGSRPVRVGNDAWRQRQLDVLGEVLDGAHLLRDRLGELSDPVRGMLIGLADRAAEAWRQPDYGMWEARDRTRHYLSSKVMCWVALDRAVKLAAQLGAEVRVGSWTAARDSVRSAILERGWDPKVRAFTGAFDSGQLDASVLLMPLVGFLPATDARVRGTIDRVSERLASDHGVQRWEGEGSGFVLCGFWLSECLALAGDADGAAERFESTAAAANDLGLLAEETDLESGELLGNHPQALSHVGLINSAWRLTQLDQTERSTADDRPIDR